MVLCFLTILTTPGGCQLFQGVPDLYYDTGAIALYMLASPDCVRMIEEFERVNKLPLESPRKGT